MSRVVRSPEAEDDLAEIWLYVAEDNIEMADRLLDRLNQKAQSLLSFPEMGHERAELAPSLRSVSEASYLIFLSNCGSRH